jgi:hypothetical protein
VTSRIVTKEDIQNVLSYHRFQQYTAFVLYGALTDQRSLSTISKLTVSQFQEAIKSDKPCIEVRSSQDKIKMHYMPLHPQVIQAIEPLLDNRNGANVIFDYNSLAMWVNVRRFHLQSSDSFCSW